MVRQVFLLVIKLSYLFLLIPSVSKISYHRWTGILDHDLMDIFSIFTSSVYYINICLSNSFFISLVFSRTYLKIFNIELCLELFCVWERVRDFMIAEGSYKFYFNLCYTIFFFKDLLRHIIRQYICILVCLKFLVISLLDFYWCYACL